LTLHATKIDAMTQSLDCLNVNTINACAPFLFMIIMDLLTM